MGLAKKNFLYSILISLLFVALVTGYFIFMLPSLYEAHMTDVNYQSAVKLHQTYMTNGNYDGAEVRNPTGCMSIRIPSEGNVVQIYSMNFKAQVTINDETLKKFVNKIAQTPDLSEEDIAELIDDMKDAEIIDTLTNKENSGTAEPIKIDFEANKKFWNAQIEADVKMHQVNNHLFVLESQATDKFNQYITYLAFEQVENGIVVTTLPVMAPKIGEIKPVVLSSLPMITVVVFLLVLLFSQMYSRKIVNPIIDISHYAGSAMQFSDSALDKLEIKRNDEIGDLAVSINEMYDKLSESYKELKEKNHALADENKRQEVFMRASSHQLKTPIAAALLLTDGMIAKIGKYKDYEEYLPQVKNQLLSMKKMVDDILYLNGQIDGLHVETIDVADLTKKVIDSYRIQIDEKKLNIIMDESSLLQNSDGELLAKILDNLISNAVNYTKNGEKVELIFQNDRWTMVNYGCKIDEEILPNIFEPFVSGNQTKKGHGLGLYVASYYAGLLRHKIFIQNEENAVRTEIVFMNNN